MVAARAAKLRRLLPLLPLAFATIPTGGASAHLLDAYLQATLVAIEPGDIRLRINLTPGVAVADQVLAAIDRDRDGAISAEESAAYAESLRHDLIVQLDRRGVELTVAAFDMPAPVELRTGSGVIRTEFSLAPGPVAAGAHRLTLENRHFPACGAYLVNATRPKSAAVRITRQHRNDNQSVAEIDFTVHPSASLPATEMIASAAALLVVATVAGLRVKQTRVARRGRPSC